MGSGGRWAECGMFIWASDNALDGGYCICSEIIILPQYCSSIHCMVHTATPPPLKVSPPTSAAPLTLLAHPSLHLMWQQQGPPARRLGKCSNTVMGWSFKLRLGQAVTGWSLGFEVVQHCQRLLDKLLELWKAQASAGRTSLLFPLHLPSWCMLLSPLSWSSAVPSPQLTPETILLTATNCQWNKALKIDTKFSCSYDLPGPATGSSAL